jgi:hypothetical protein
MRMRDRLQWTALAVGLSWASGSLAAEPPTRIEGSLHSTSAEVIAVDQEQRLVTLRNVAGETVILEAGPEVRNLGQVEVGDVVDVELYEMLVTELQKGTPGVKKRIETVEAERAPLGAKPGAVFTRTIEFGAAVEAVDPGQRLLTLRGPERSVTLKVAPDVDLGRVAVGDHVEGSYVEQLSIVVSPAR